MEATIEIYGKSYSIVIVDNEDGTYSPSVAEVSKTGDVARMIIDAETTDEAYSDERKAMLHAMAAVV